MIVLRRSGIIILLLLISAYGLFAQKVTVVDKLTRMGLSGVKVYALGMEDTLETNQFGEVELDIFPDNQPIVFVHMYFEPVVRNKRQIERNDWLVFLPRGSMLQSAVRSLLTAKEYSYGLPFYVDIINLDNNGFFVDVNQVAGERVVSKTDEKGVTSFHSLKPNKVLLALDGLRLNNEISITGKVETSLNFQKTVLQTIQQIYDPTFLAYGPDGSGAVIHYFTKIPKLSPTYKLKVNFETTQRYESLSSNWLSNYQLNVANDKLASFTSVTYSKFGDIVAGHNRRFIPREDSLYGLHLYYVDRIDNRDTILPNPDPFVQLQTGFTQLYILQKFRYKINSEMNLMFNTYYSSTSDMGIYSGVTEYNGDYPRFAECKYYPVENLTTTANLYINSDKRFFSFASLLLAFQNIEEYRYTRKFNNPVGLHQIENLRVGSFFADFVKIFNISRMAYGFSYRYNDLNSHAYFENIITDSTFRGLTRFPTNGAYSHWLSAYLHYRNLSSSQFRYEIGARIDAYYSDARFDTTPPQFALPFDEVKGWTYSPNLSFKMDAFPFPFLRLDFNTETYTHLPVFDQYAKVMFKNTVIQLPTNQLKPETSFNTELSATLYLKEDDIKVNITGFDTYVKNYIMYSDATLNGEDSISFGPNRYNFVQYANYDLVQIYGFSAGLNMKFYLDKKHNNYVSLVSIFNYSKAIDKSDTLPVPKIPPYFGKNNFTVKIDNYKFELIHLFNGGKAIDELSPYGEDFIEKASIYGFLPWSIIDLRLSYKYNDRMTFSYGLNNVFDVFYIPYSSAVAGPGRNFIITCKLKL